MKKIFTLSSLAILSLVLFTGCYKERNVTFNEDYWLSKERGEVVYSDSYCDYFVVETNNGYSVLRSFDGYKPYEGSFVYGDFSYSGTHDVYNRSSGRVFTSTVTDYWLTYYEAQDAVDYYCPYITGRATSSTSEFRIKKK
ncbi:MAG: hypothetical protein H7Y42_05460 [Chitinophagaceae bacterium]|nr:hypothetical protein [Chitinophagaceae bacterium]